MPKQTTPAMETHIAQEVTTLAHCVYIEQKNGRVIRMTDHDKNLTVGGEVYFSNLGFNLSAIESTVGLSIDNASIRVGIDGTVFVKNDFASGRFHDAKFGVFMVNWQDPDGGTIWLKKGFIGKSSWSDTKDEATIELLGQTAALSGKSIEQYSPTCRADLGDERCSFCNIPNRIRSTAEQFTTGNYFLKPTSQTAGVLVNPSWETDGSVVSGLTGITGWSRTAGSLWGVGNAFPGVDGAYHLFNTPSTNNQKMWQEVSTSSLGIVPTDITDGKVMVNATCGITPTTAVAGDVGRAYIFIESLDANGSTLQKSQSRQVTKRNRRDVGDWVTLSTPIMLHPDTKSLRVGVFVYANSSMAFDSFGVSFFNHEARADFDNTYLKTVKIFNNSGTINTQGSLNLQNNKFSKDGPILNVEASGFASWTIPAASWWKTSTAEGIMVPSFGQYMLVAGNDSSGSQSTYTMKQSRSVTSLGMVSDDVADGWWYSEASIWFSNINDSLSDIQITMTYYNATNTLISTKVSGWKKSVLVNQWDAKPLRLGGTVPSGTTTIEMEIQVRTAPGSSEGNMAIDMAELASYPVAFEGELDPDWGKLSLNPVTYNTTPKAYTTDGDILVQAGALTFGYGQVSGELNSRSFLTTNIDFTPAEMYAGEIYWLTGVNAGLTSIVRVFDAATGTVSVYRNLVATPSIGDKFIFSKGCDKTIDTCADRFNNAINFRGEPYLPGTENIITFLSQN